MPPAIPKALSYLKDKDPSALHTRFAKWIKANGGGDIDPKAIQVVLSSHGTFQKSPENQAAIQAQKERIAADAAAREERAAERERKRGEREAAAAERAERQAEKNAGKSDTPPVKKAAPAKPAAKATPAKATTAKAAPAKAAAKPAPRKPTAKAKAAAGGDFDSQDF